MKRFLAMLLALVMLLSLVACSKKKSSDTEEDDWWEEETEETKETKKTGTNEDDERTKETDQQTLIVESDSGDKTKKYDAKIKNLNGHEFRFVVRDSTAKSLSVNEVYAENINGDKVNDAVYARNAQLKKDYNCTIVEDRQSNPTSAVREHLIAGEYVTDYILGNVSNLRSLAAANLLADLNKVSTIDLDKAWWDHNAIEGINLGGMVYFLTGDGTTLDDRAARIMLFNKDWIEEYDPKLNLYDVVEKGEWTIDLMYELMVNTAKDLDGDGVLTIGVDRFGYVGEGFNNWVHVNGCGQTLSRVSPSGEYEIPAQPKAELLEVWEALRPVLTSPTRVVGDKESLFTAGLATFYGSNLGKVLNAPNSTVDFGVLPLPKLNQKQDKYYGSVSYTQLGCFAIPTTVENCEDWETNGFNSGVEQAAYFLEAFCYQSMRILTPAFYDQVILKQSLRDVESAKMVEYATENKIYDPVAGYDFGKMLTLFYEVGSPNNDAPGSDAAYDTFVSTYGSRYTAARKALQDYLNYINTETL